MPTVAPCPPLPPGGPLPTRPIQLAWHTRHILQESRQLPRICSVPCRRHQMQAGACSAGQAEKRRRSGPAPGSASRCSSAARIQPAHKTAAPSKSPAPRAFMKTGLASHSPLTAQARHCSLLSRHSPGGSCIAGASPAAPLATAPPNGSTCTCGAASARGAGQRGRAQEVGGHPRWGVMASAAASAGGRGQLAAAATHPGGRAPLHSRDHWAAGVVAKRVLLLACARALFGAQAGRHGRRASVPSMAPPPTASSTASSAAAACRRARGMHPLTAPPSQPASAHCQL